MADSAAVATMVKSGPARAGGQRMVPTHLPTAANACPSARSFAEERQYRKQRLAVAMRLFARMGFTMGVSGHFTARDPEFPDRFWVNPFILHFASIRVSDLLLVDHDGTILEGAGKVNQAGFAIHSELHKARPDVVGAAHLHSFHGKCWSSMGRLLQPLCQDSAIFFEDHALFDAYSGVVDDTAEGARIAVALGSKNNVILKNHGILSVGTSVEAAAWRYLAFDNACAVQLQVEAAGGGQPMPDDVARHTHRQVGSDLAAVYSFEPYWAMMLAAEPDVLD